MDTRRSSLLALLTSIAFFVSLSAPAEQGSLVEGMSMRGVKVTAGVEFEQWQPRRLDIAVEPETDSEAVRPFVDALLPALRQQFQMHGFEFDPTASTKIRVSIDEFDSSGRGGQLFGRMFGRGSVFGSLTVLEDGQVAGTYQFSARTRSFLRTNTATEVAEKFAPTLALKLIRGQRDNKLHSYRNARLKSA